MKNREKEPFFHVYKIITKIGLTKLDELNKIWWYREKYGTVKDREKEEYTSQRRREKGSSAERPFVGRLWKVALESFCRRGDLCRQKREVPLQTAECPFLWERELRWYRELSSFLGRELFFFTVKIKKQEEKT